MLTLKEAKSFGRKLNDFRDRLKAEIAIKKRELMWTDKAIASHFGKNHKYIKQIIKVNKGKEDESIELYIFLCHMLIIEKQAGK